MITANSLMTSEELKELELKSLLKSCGLSYDKMKEIIKEVEAEKAKEAAEVLRKKEKEKYLKKLSEAREKLIDCIIEYTIALSDNTITVSGADRKELVKMFLFAEEEMAEGIDKCNDFFKSLEEPAAFVKTKEKEVSPSEAEDIINSFLATLCGEEEKNRVK